MSDWSLKDEVCVLYDLWRRGDVDALDEIRWIFHRNLVGPVSCALFSRRLNFELVDEVSGNIYDARDLVSIKEGVVLSSPSGYQHRPPRGTSRQVVSGELYGVYGDHEWSPAGPGLWALVPYADGDRWVPVVPRSHVEEELAQVAIDPAGDRMTSFPLGFLLFFLRIARGIL